MATLKQDANSNTTFLGWYGSCGEPKCEKFDLSSKKDVIRTVYQFTENGKGIRTFSSSAPDFLQGFTNLNCGNSYWIILKPGTSEIKIPEFNVGYDTDESLGLISGDCTATTLTNPTPTPTPQKSRPCTTDIRVCPDGSTVGRNSNDNCRFLVCGWDADEFRTRANEWKYNEPLFYSFTFMYTGSKMPNDRVRVTVRFGRIVKMQKLSGAKEEISLDYNDSISDQEHFAPDGRSRILTLSQLFSWSVSKLNTNDRRPFSVEMKYNEEFDYIERCDMTYKKLQSQDESTYSIGFLISDFKEYEYKGKCPPHKKRCKDGTYVKRDPDNNCKFENCGESVNQTPTPDFGIETPLMKFRWLEVDGKSILQIKNLPNPLEDGVIAEYRTVYGSNSLNPAEQMVFDWQHIKVSDGFVKLHNKEVKYENMGFTFDSEHENQIVVDLGHTSEFILPQSNVDEVSHLYLYRGDTSETDYELASTFPYIIKTDKSDGNMDGSGPMACTEDAKVCDGGSVLVRDPFNNCEFPDCPDDSDVDVHDDDTLGDEFVPPMDDPIIESNVDEGATEDDSIDEFVPPMDDPIIESNVDEGATEDDSIDEFVPPMDDLIIE